MSKVSLVNNDIFATNGLDVSKKHPRNSYKVRYHVVKLWDGKCFWCHAELVSPEGDYNPPEYHIDHFKPKKHGGPDNYLNYVLSCEPCNSSKQDSMEVDRIAFDRWLDYIQQYKQNHALLDDSRAFEENVLENDYIFHCRVCADHKWHITGSIADSNCISDIHKTTWPKEVNFNFLVEWWSRFGSESLKVAQEYAIAYKSIRGTSKFELIRCISGNLLSKNEMYYLENAGSVDLARSYASAQEAIDALKMGLSKSVVKRNNGADAIWFARRAKIGRENREKYIKKAIFDVSSDISYSLEEYTGIKKWKGLCDLWSDKKWPTYLIYDYNKLFIQKSKSKRSEFVRELEQFGPNDVTLLENHLKNLWLRI